MDEDAFSTTPSGAGLRFADPTKNARDAREWGVGLNWYLNRNVKWVFDYEQTDFNGGAGTETSSTFHIENRPTERIAFSRIQVLF
jgi:phosphate-selective porin OprO/OprP